MGIDVDVFVDIPGAVKHLEEFQKKHIPFALAVSLTKIGAIVRDDTRNEMQRVFNNPTRYTLNSLLLRPAQKKDINPTAVVMFKDMASRGNAPAKYLGPEVHGGPRSVKGAASLLRGKGLLSSDEFLVPSRSAKLNQHGNITRAQTMKMVAGVKTEQKVDSKSRKAQYFVGRPGGKAKGVWIRKGRKLQPFMLVTRQPQYRSRLDFYRIANKAVGKNYNKEFGRALGHAMSTGRKR
ncbi:hypothetical protein [Sansalvadorimonas verongulae]|uniref:hypothetical protein n=1 Tax=Sansalvadorimonas verongulae TaxID=2172824 RepID=UPI0012BC5304|nr:hypothetical protein [Sansalvadorimonas verongulae]MTI13349.1 hypothetical protein [Sansalvadorimonas verongulae]